MAVSLPGIIHGDGAYPSSGSGDGGIGRGLAVLPKVDRASRNHAKIGNLDATGGGNGLGRGWNLRKAEGNSLLGGKHEGTGRVRKQAVVVAKIRVKGDGAGRGINGQGVIASIGAAHLDRHGGVPANPHGRGAHQLQFRPRRVGNGEIKESPQGKSRGLGDCGSPAFEGDRRRAGVILPSGYIDTLHGQRGGGRGWRGCPAAGKGYGRADEIARALIGDPKSDYLSKSCAVGAKINNRFRLGLNSIR